MVLFPIFASLLTVAFPSEKQRLPHAERTYVIGAVPTNEVHALLVNGATTDVYRTGAFVCMAPMTNGTNELHLKWGTNELVRTFRVDSTNALPVVSPPPSTRNIHRELGVPEGLVDATPPADKPLEDMLVMIDPGHGGYELGAISPHGLCEKDANLMQAIEISNVFNEHGIETVLTREDDSRVPLKDRPMLAYQWGADAFISVHHNANAVQSDPRKARHTTSYGYTANGIALASAIQKRIAEVMKPVRNVPASHKSLAVCRNPAVPSCLIEVDFVNLPEGEDAIWHDVERRHKVAEAVYLGFLDWLGRSDMHHSSDRFAARVSPLVDICTPDDTHAGRAGAPRTPLEK